MNKFNGLNEKEIALVKEAGYMIKLNNEYSEDDYEKCANTITDYIMSHSKNEIPEVENKYRDILRKII